MSWCMLFWLTFNKTLPAAKLVASCWLADVVSGLAPQVVWSEHREGGLYLSGVVEVVVTTGHPPDLQHTSPGWPAAICNVNTVNSRRENVELRPGLWLLYLTLIKLGQFQFNTKTHHSVFYSQIISDFQPKVAINLFSGKYNLCDYWAVVYFPRGRWSQSGILMSPNVIIIRKKLRDDLPFHLINISVNLFTGYWVQSSWYISDFLHWLSIEFKISVVNFKEYRVQNIVIHFTGYRVQASPNMCRTLKIFQSSRQDGLSVDWRRRGSRVAGSY